MTEQPSYGWGWLIGIGVATVGVGFGVGFVVGRARRAAATSAPALPSADHSGPPVLEGAPPPDTTPPSPPAEPPPVDPAMVKRFADLFGEVPQRQTLPVPDDKLAAFALAMGPTGASAPAVTAPFVATLQRQLVALGIPGEPNAGTTDDATRKAWQRWLQLHRDWLTSESAACDAATSTKAEARRCLAARALARIDGEFGALATRARYGGIAP